MGNHFVIPGGGGSQNGTSWTNAYSAAGIGAVSPGDIVWFAGGSYSEVFTPPATNGTSGNPITYQKVLGTDPASVTTGVSGWNSTFGSSICNFSTAPGGFDGAQYLTFNGRVTNGFTFLVTAGYGGWNFTANSSSSTLATNLTFQYITMNGPGWTASGNSGTNQGTYGIQMAAGQGNGTNMLVDHCIFNGIIQQITMYANSSTVQYCQFLNCNGNTTNHPDTIYCGAPNNLIVRWCYFYQSAGESVFFDGGGSNNALFYGNVANQGPLGSGAFLEQKQQFTWNGLNVYNNTFVGWDQPVYMRGNSNSVADILKNNIFWNCSWLLESPMPAPVSDYNGYNGGVPSGETHSVNNTTNPFVDVTDASINPANFALTAGSWPINIGTNLGAPYTTDMFGNTGTSMGAIQFSGSVPPPPVNPQASGKGSATSHPLGLHQIFRPIVITRF